MDLYRDLGLDRYASGILWDSATEMGFVMSTYYRPTGRMPLIEIKWNAKGFNVVYLEEQKEEVFVTKDENYLHFNTNGHGDVIDLFRYGNNLVAPILVELEDMFKVVIVSEYDEEYYSLADRDTQVINLTIDMDKFRAKPIEEE